MKTNEAPSVANAHEKGQTQGVAAVAGGSAAGDALPQPKPLICRLADLMKEWRQTRDNMKARGEDDAAIAVECCMETLHEDVTNFMKEMKEYREHCAKQPNAGDVARGGGKHSTQSKT